VRVWDGDAGKVVMTEFVAGTSELSLAAAIQQM